MTAKSSLIIRRPNLQTRFQRTLFGFITLVLWLLWIYLWLPLITAILWILGIRAAYLDLFLGARGLGLIGIGWISLIALVTMTYWSLYNRFRYAKKMRRKSSGAVAKSDIAAVFGVTDPGMIADLTQKRSLVIRFGSAGTVARVEAGPGVMPSPELNP